MNLDLFNNKCIITSRDNWDFFLKIKQSRPDINFKLIEKSELISKLTFEYDDRSLIFLHRLGYSYDNSKEIMKNLILLKRGISKKVDDLIDIYSKLESEKLIIHDNLFLKYISKKEVLLYEVDDFIVKRLLDLNKIKYQEYQDEIACDLSCYEFKNFDDEIRFLFEKIFSLFKQGVCFNKIKIVTADKRYLSVLRKYQDIYNLRFANVIQNKFFYTFDYKVFKSIFKTTILDQTLDFSEDKIDDYSSLNKIISHYLKVKNYIKDKELEEFLDYNAKNIDVQFNHYDDEIEITTLDRVNDEDYVFILGFHLNNYPSLVRDDDYLSDREKQALSLTTSLMKQQSDEKKLIRKICHLKNCYISLCLQDGDKVFYPSRLIDKLKMKIIDDYHFENIVFSKDCFDLYMGKIFDDEKNFSFYHPYYNSCLKEDINYLNYNHRFNKFSFNQSSLKLTYTKIQSFYECSFKYYLNYILKADEFTDSIASIIGSFTHHLMELKIKGFNVDFDLELNRLSIKPSYRLLINALKEQILVALDHVYEMFKNSQFDKALAESDNYIYRIDEKSYLEGKIDLIMYNDNDFAIIDYKTNDTKIDLGIIKYGLNMQLPIYVLLCQESKLNIINKKLTGLYINTIISKDYYQDKKDYILLKGLTITESDFDKIGREYIKPKRKKYIPFGEDNYKALLDMTKEKIAEAAKRIKDGQFDINPKKKKNTNLSCTFCEFYDICYHDYHDDVYFEDDEEEK